MTDKRIFEMPNTKPRKSKFNIEDLIKKLSAIESGVSVQSDFAEALLCLANEITELKEKNTIKPIFSVGIPEDNHEDDYINIIEERLSEKLVDYHVILYVHRNEDIEFKCFYEKDFKEIKFDELKKIVKDNLILTKNK